MGKNDNSEGKQKANVITDRVANIKLHNVNTDAASLCYYVSEYSQFSDRASDELFSSNRRLFCFLWRGNKTNNRARRDINTANPK